MTYDIYCSKRAVAILLKFSTFSTQILILKMVIYLTAELMIPLFAQSTLHKGSSNNVCGAVLVPRESTKLTKNTGTSFVCTKYAHPNNRVAPGIWKAINSYTWRYSSSSDMV